MITTATSWTVGSCFYAFIREDRTVRRDVKAHGSYLQPVFLSGASRPCVKETADER